VGALGFCDRALNPFLLFPSTLKWEPIPTFRLHDCLHQALVAMAGSKGSKGAPRAAGEAAGEDAQGMEGRGVEASGYAAERDAQHSLS
jgi:predicted HNH restriction endonuclease